MFFLVSGYVCGCLGGAARRIRGAWRRLPWFWPQRSPWRRTSEFTVAEHGCSANYDRVDSGGLGLRIRIGRGVSDLVKVEQRDIRYLPNA
jgi:hypothetical protein